MVVITRIDGTTAFGLVPRLREQPDHGHLLRHRDMRSALPADGQQHGKQAAGA
jgi:hypothetical protein